jgi:hypothetical protein
MLLIGRLHNGGDGIADGLHGSTEQIPCAMYTFLFICIFKVWAQDVFFLVEPMSAFTSLVARIAHVWDYEDHKYDLYVLIYVDL